MGKERPPLSEHRVDATEHEAGEVNDRRLVRLFLAQTVVARLERTTHAAGAIRGLHHDPAHIRRALLGEWTIARPSSARVDGWHKAGVRSQVGSVGKAPDVTDLRQKEQRRERAHARHRVQPSSLLARRGPLVYLCIGPPG